MDDFSGNSTFYDGGVVEYSTDNGATWNDAGALFTDWGYQGQITNDTSADGNPLAGRQGYVGRSDGYFSSRLNLTSLAGKNVRVRFRIGADRYVGDRGWFIDDVRVYTCGTRPAPSATNKLRNPDFEYDDDDNGRPDAWSQDNSALRMPRRTGGYSMRHKAVDNQPYAVGQVVGGLTAGTSYTFSGWLNIPATTQAVNFALDVQWRNSTGAVIGTTVIKAYADDSAGVWKLSSQTMVAPAGTVSAKVCMVQRSLGATVYADSFLFRQ